MNYGQILKADSANGIGIRLSLFVSGCTNCCKGCFQPETWDFNYGKVYTKETEDFIIEELSKSYYDGITILGGEPFEPCNQEELVKLIRRIRAELPQRTIWMYTGFTYDKDLQYGQRKHTYVTDEILDSIDILVDGKFILEEKDITLNFRGSRNQRIIDMKKTKESGEIVLHPLNERKK
ncbi:MAG: anaerobic ribonucleoside-triphosphate reductase activating protein [Pseudobutyrivibrio sp.]|nr:anaerobic ribonucleoside-triphosphate reductase activating protein [Pseudobutyrivibrio sp.]